MGQLDPASYLLAPILNLAVRIGRKTPTGDQQSPVSDTPNELIASISFFFSMTCGREPHGLSHA